MESGRLIVPFVRSADNLADFFTKPLIPKVFFALRNQIMNVPDPLSSNGGVLSEVDSPSLESGPSAGDASVDASPLSVNHAPASQH